MKLFSSFGQVLPPEVRAILSISDVKDLDQLAHSTDTVIDNIRPRSEVAEECRSDIHFNKKNGQLNIKIA